MAVRRFGPGFRKGARSNVSKRQKRMSPRDGPMPTRRPFTCRTKRWSPLTWTTKRAGTAGRSIDFRKRKTPASRSGAPGQAIHAPVHCRSRTASEIGRPLPEVAAEEGAARPSRAAERTTKGLALMRGSPGNEKSLGARLDRSASG
jgi:hypothetical protein